MSRQIIGFCEETGCKYPVPSKVEFDALTQNLVNTQRDLSSLEGRVTKLEPEVITDFTNFNVGNPLNWTYTKNYTTNKIGHNKVTVVGEIYNWSVPNDAKTLQKRNYTFRVTFNIPDEPENIPSVGQYVMYEAPYNISHTWMSGDDNNITVSKNFVQVMVHYDAPDSVSEDAYLTISLEKFHNGDWEGIVKSDGTFVTNSYYVPSITKIILENE